MNLRLNGYSDCSIVTTDNYASNTHIPGLNIDIINTLSSGREGQFLIFKNGRPQWVDMPSVFIRYYSQVSDSK